MRTKFELLNRKIVLPPFLRLIIHLYCRNRRVKTMYESKLKNLLMSNPNFHKFFLTSNFNSLLLMLNAVREDKWLIQKDQLKSHKMPHTKKKGQKYCSKQMNYLNVQNITTTVVCFFGQKTRQSYCHTCQNMFLSEYTYCTFVH